MDSIICISHDPKSLFIFHLIVLSSLEECHIDYRVTVNPD